MMADEVLVLFVLSAALKQDGFGLAVHVHQLENIVLKLISTIYFCLCR